MPLKNNKTRQLLHYTGTRSRSPMIPENLNICSKFEFIHLDLTNLRTVELSEPVYKPVTELQTIQVWSFRTTAVPRVVLTMASYHRLPLHTVVITLTSSIWHLETLKEGEL